MCILLEIYYLLFIFILDHGNEVRQKANSRDFRIRVQDGSYSSRDNSKHQQCVWPRVVMLTNIQGSGGSRSFAKQTRTLKMRNAVAGHWKLSVTNWEADPLIQEVAKKFSVSHSTVVMQIGKVRKFGKWVSHELTAIKKIVILKCRLLLFYAITTKHFSMRLWHTIKNWFYMTTGNNQLSGWTERKLQSPFQSQTCTKKIYGHCLVACCWSDPPQLSESQWNH